MIILRATTPLHTSICTESDRSHVVSIHSCCVDAHACVCSVPSPHAASLLSPSPPLCSRHPDILCDVGEFHCHNHDTCVPEDWLCDGEPDCPDESDETDHVCKFLIPSISYWCTNTCHMKFCHNSSFDTKFHICRLILTAHNIICVLPKKVTLFLFVSCGFLLHAALVILTKLIETKHNLNTWKEKNVNIWFKSMIWIQVNPIVDVCYGLWKYACSIYSHIWHFDSFWFLRLLRFPLLLQLTGLLAACDVAALNTGVSLSFAFLC